MVDVNQVSSSPSDDVIAPKKTSATLSRSIALKKVPQRRPYGQHRTEIEIEGLEVLALDNTKDREAFIIQVIIRHLHRGRFRKSC